MSSEYVKVIEPAVPWQVAFEMLYESGVAKANIRTIYSLVNKNGRRGSKLEYLLMIKQPHWFG